MILRQLTIHVSLIILSNLVIHPQPVNIRLYHYLPRKMKKDRQYRKPGYNIGIITLKIGSVRFRYQIGNYNIEEGSKAINCPNLFLYAENEIKADPEQNIDQFIKVLSNKPIAEFTILTWVGGLPGFNNVSDRCVSWEVAERQSFDPKIHNEIRNRLIKL